MYIIELTDNYIYIYNKKNKSIIKEPIDNGIIINNRIYDYLKLVNILNKIVNKYRFINNLFRVKVKVLVFEKISPSERYLIKNLFKFTTNILVETVNVNNYFKDEYLIISGKNIYHNNRKLNKINKGNYILIGNATDLDIIKDELEKKYKVDILEYENSKTIIYETI